MMVTVVYFHGPVTLEEAKRACCERAARTGQRHVVIQIADWYALAVGGNMGGHLPVVYDPTVDGPC
jgi:hypothetical protein